MLVQNNKDYYGAKDIHPLWRYVLTISTHPLWGPVIQAVLVQEESEDALTILETVTQTETLHEELYMNESAKKIIAFTGNYSDHSLMKNYSKEKTLKAFHANISPEAINTYIRPGIDGYHRKIIKLLDNAGMPLYVREGTQTRALWPHDRVQITENASQMVFTFEKDKQSGLHYYIRIESNNSTIDLYSKKIIILSREPAIVVVDKTLLFFEDVDAKKLTPFCAKKVIDVPASSESQYFKTFVRNCVMKYKVNAIGVDIREIQPQKEAHISLEADWTGKPALLIALYYENKKYPLDYPDRKIVLVDDNEGYTSLRWFHPDKLWEDYLVRLLLDNGLQQTGPNHFSFVAGEGEELPGEMFGMVEWIRMHLKVLEAFHFSQNLLDRTYFLGEISVETKLEAGHDWFDLNCLAVFGDFSIPFIRFRNHILENKREYILPDGSIAVLPSEWFDRYYELMFFSKNSRDVLRLKKNQYKLIESFKEIPLEKLISTDLQLLPEVPAAIKTKLRPYQIAGFQWLVWLYQNGFGGCLADDMGLGKTIQTIALMEYISSGRRLDTCSFVQQNPIEGQLSLFGNWDVDKVGKLEKEERVPPSLIVMPTSLLYNWQSEFRKFAPDLRVYTYSGTKRNKSENVFNVFRHYHVILTTYGTLRNDIEFLKICQFHHLILDESQYVKNPDSLLYKAVRQIDALYKLALSGTPIENSMTDLWALLSIVNENMLGSFSTFKKIKEDALLRIIQPFLLRRTKKEVTPELPPLLQETVYCDMSLEQKACYQTEKNKLRNSLLDMSILAKPSQLSILTLQGLTRLRLLANHPQLVLPDYTGDSGKFDQIIMRFETLKAEGHKVLIFSSFVKHLRILAEYFEKENWCYAWLTGATPVAEREKEIARFAHEPETACFFISLKAGGVGLNLTSADYVFIIDPWWNPAAEMQALSRSHRIGQDKSVIVYRFISSRTIEEKIQLLQHEKAKLAETFVSSGNPLANLGLDDLNSLLS